MCNYFLHPFHSKHFPLSYRLQKCVLKCSWNAPPLECLLRATVSTMNNSLTFLGFLGGFHPCLGVCLSRYAARHAQSSAYFPVSHAVLLCYYEI